MDSSFPGVSLPKLRIFLLWVYSCCPFRLFGVVLQKSSLLTCYVTHFRDLIFIDTIFFLFSAGIFGNIFKIFQESATSEIFYLFHKSFYMIRIPECCQESVLHAIGYLIIKI